MPKDEWDDISVLEKKETNNISEEQEVLSEINELNELLEETSPDDTRVVEEVEEVEKEEVEVEEVEVEEEEVEEEEVEEVEEVEEEEVEEEEEEEEEVEEEEVEEEEEEEEEEVSEEEVEEVEEEVEEVEEEEVEEMTMEERIAEDAKIEEEMARQIEAEDSSLVSQTEELEEEENKPFEKNKCVNCDGSFQSKCFEIERRCEKWKIEIPELVSLKPLANKLQVVLSLLSKEQPKINNIIIDSEEEVREIVLLLDRGIVTEFKKELEEGLDTDEVNVKNYREKLFKLYKSIISIYINKSMNINSNDNIPNDLKIYDILFMQMVSYLFRETSIIKG